jgi:hypothetical protein
MTGSGAPSHPEAAAASHKTAMPAEKRDSAILSSVSREERHALICNAAYYLAERRGFANGDPAQPTFRTSAGQYLVNFEAPLSRP